MLYSLDLRKRVVSAVNGGMTKSQAVRVFNVCRQTVYSWLELEEHTGSLEPQTGFQRGHSHKIPDLEGFQAFVDAHPDLTRAEMAEHYSVSPTTIGRALKKIGYTRKKEPDLCRKE